jgi:polar amino acid transport system ATP-binding protein
VTAGAPVLRAEGLRKSFGDRTVLAGVDLEVDRGDVVALIGPSGSGKSTLLRCLNLLERPDDGRIWLGDEDITDPRADADRVRARFGVVFQQFNLFPHRTVLDNVTLAMRVIRRVPRAQAEEEGLALLDRIGLAGRAHEHPDRLSGGQQQRTAIVRAIAAKPEVLLLDEITSALDPELVGEVLELVRELAATTTIVMATHELPFARDVATQVLFLDGGRIVERGTPSEVLVSPRELRTQEFLRRFRQG